MTLSVVIGVLALVAALAPAGPAGAGGGPSVLPIYDIHGSGHIQPYDGVFVSTTGIVTAVAFSGYYVQDPFGDGNEETADGLFVFNGSAPKPSVGDELLLTDFVSEFIPSGSGGFAAGNLSTTQMSFPSTLELSTGNPLPDPVVIGTGGRVAHPGHR